MTQEEILEYNKRCALFCTSEPEVLKRDLEKAGTLESMQYHSDWNWIMEVVEAIQKLKFNVRMTISCVTIENAFDNYYSNLSPIYEFHSIEGEKEAVVNAINQFLIWYEKNKS